MRVESIYCDNCGKEIPKVKEKDIFENEIEYHRFGKLNFGYPFENIDCSSIGIDLCEKCAGNINLDMQRVRMEMILK